MKHVCKQSGSGLLLTVLTLTVFAAVSVLLTQVLTSTMRVSGLQSVAGESSAMADQGLQEGLLRYSQFKQSVSIAALNPFGEYGIGADTSAGGGNSYSLLPFSRGYTAGCAVLGGDNDLKIDFSCPNYKLAVRSRILLQPGTSFTFPAQIFAAGSPTSIVVYNLNGGTGGVVQFSTRYGAKYDITCNSGCDNNKYNVKSGPFQSITISANSAQLQIDPNKSKTELTVAISSLSLLNMIIDKGFTTIESTGYAGGVHVEKLLNIYDKSDDPSFKWPSSRKAVRQAAQTYGSNGCFIYDQSPPACTAQ